MGYTVKKIWYFDNPGEENTSDALNIAVERAIDLGIRYLVVASTSGKTATIAAERVKRTGISLIIVTHAVGFSSPGVWEFDASVADALRAEGVKIVTGTHVLSGLERAFSSSPKVGGGSRSEAVSESLRRIIAVGLKFAIECVLIAVGLKFAIECVLIAADQGAVPVLEEVVAVGGTANGADTVCVIRPSHTNRLFELQVREIVAMPRER
jgi:hypothetical protein